MTHAITRKTAIVATALFVLLTATTAEAQQDIEGQKLAQTGFKFLSQSVDARAAALGTNVTAIDGFGARALFYNPATMARSESTVGVWLGLTQWVGEINYNAGALALNPADGRYGVFGISVMSVDYGDFLGTVRADNEQGFVDIGTYSPTAFAVGVGYAKQITDRFDVGGQIKYASQDLGASTMSMEGGSRTTQDRDANTLAYDFGVLYRTGFRSLNFAVTARNFSKELTYVEESFELPLTVSIGFAVDAFELTGRSNAMHDLTLSTSMSHPRDYPEQVSLGAEYVFMDLLALRAGYVFPADEHGVSLGAGLQTSVSGFNAAFDYGYTPFGELGNVNRLSVALSL